MPFNKKIRTLRAFLFEQGVEGTLRGLICEIAEASKYVDYAIKMTELGFAGTTNVFGEKQLALDVLSDELISSRLGNCGLVVNMASEEQQNIFSSFLNEPGEYSVCFDPLDGSSLVDVNLAVGTIVSIYPGEDLVRPGREQVAALFVLYGPRTTMVVGIQNGVHEFTLNPLGSYTLSRENIRMEESGKIYSPGGDSRKYSPGHAALIESLKNGGHKLRYSGGMVPDINHVLMKRGGLFTYPALEGSPRGKLRLMFEANPMAFILEKAGGAASEGTMRILDVEPESIQDRCPVYLGSKKEVALAEKMLKKSASEKKAE
ncbi:MAG: fructose-1,6-bisphosphatase [Candidatus Coatesbacteria bacterium]|nr:fructose-1,6-bisphosphatase [Candidatus Coatesbacteria bacterium]